MDCSRMGRANDRWRTWVHRLHVREMVLDSKKVILKIVEKGLYAAVVC